MSKTGNWGDKIIVSLHSDEKRRHKKWCDNYREGNYCIANCGRCTGSAHCDFYKNKSEADSNVSYCNKPPRVERETDKHAEMGFIWREYYRPANYGDRLLHSTVLVRSTPYTFRIGEVVNEDLYYFVVKYDGKEHKYSKKTAYRNRSVYIFGEMRNAAISAVL